MTEEYLHSLSVEAQERLYHNSRSAENLSDMITRCPHCGTFMTEHTLLVEGGREHNCPYCGEHIVTSLVDCE